MSKTHLRENRQSGSARAKIDALAERIQLRARYTLRPRTAADHAMLAEHRRRKEGAR